MIEIPESMSAAVFRRLIEREHEQVELKKGAGRRPLQAVLVAMSNTDGGVIFIGIDDDRTVVGPARSRRR